MDLATTAHVVDGDGGIGGETGRGNRTINCINGSIGQKTYVNTNANANFGIGGFIIFTFGLAVDLYRRVGIETGSN